MQIKSKKKPIAKFSGLSGKHCSHCHRPIHTYELVRLNDPDFISDKYYHVGCYNRLVNKKKNSPDRKLVVKVDNSNKSNLKFFLFVSSFILPAIIAIILN